MRRRCRVKKTTSRKLQSNINASTHQHASMLSAQHCRPFHGSAHASPRLSIATALMLCSHRPLYLARVASLTSPSRCHCNTLSYVDPADENWTECLLVTWWVFFYLILGRFLTFSLPSLPRRPRPSRPRHVTHAAMRSRSSSLLLLPSPSGSVVTALSPR
jgi:hypothetical protein